MKKAAHRDCFCALCRTPRKLRYARGLKARHYGQILVLTIVAAAIMYPWFDWKGVMSLPIIWGIFESTHSSLYRKDLKCPFCGFDPSWYKKDVKFARQQVEDFLKQNPNSPLHRRTKIEENSNYPLN